MGLGGWGAGGGWCQLGIIIRGISKGQVPPGSFVGITMASTLVIVLSWRVAFAALSGAKRETQSSKQGNPFEFFQVGGRCGNMITGLALGLGLGEGWDSVGVYLHSGGLQDT